MGEIFCFQSKSFQHDTCKSWTGLQEEKHLCDMTLACTDGQVEAHKVVLSACSPVFRNLIKAHPHNHPFLFLRGVKYSELVHMLNFMYQGEVNISQEEVPDFVEVGQDLKLIGLTQENEADSVTNGGEHNKVEPSNTTMDDTQDRDEDDKEEEENLDKSNPIAEDLVTKSEPEKENKETPKKELEFNHSIFSKNWNIKTETPDNIQDEEGFLSEEHPNDFKQEDYIGAAEIENGLKSKQGRKRTRTYLSENGVDKAAKEGRYACELCDYKTVSSSNLTKHVKAKHLGIRYPCDQCEYQSTNQSNLKKHIKSVHPIWPIGQFPAIKP